MRWIHLGIIILFATATIVFALQNFDIVKKCHFSASMRAYHSHW